jgi:hypothetical protein
MKKLIVKIKKDFLDLETGLKRVQGKTMSVTEDRFLELHRKGYVEIDKGEVKPIGKPNEIKK